MASAICIASVAAGAGFALLGRQRGHAVASIRTFALVTAVVAVLGQLLPEALSELGLPALVAFGAAALFPVVLERFAARAHESHIGLELGYFGLIWHKVGDGLGVASYVGGSASVDVVAAIAAHTVPVTALVVVAYKTRHGVFTALVRATGLALAMLVGVGIVHATGGQDVSAWEPWVTAVVAGLLLHVAAHDWHAEPPPTTASRLFDFAAIGAAVVLLWLGGHADHTSNAASKVGGALVELTLETAPALLIGLLVGALFQLFGSKLPLGWLRSGPPLRQAIRGAIVGAPVPICACGVLPLAQSLRARGAGVALVLAFLLATPELGVETFALTVRFLGWPFAWVRLGAALFLAVAVALLVARATGSPNGHDAIDVPWAEDEAHGSAWRRFVHHFDELLVHVGPWTAIGLVVASYVQATLPDGALVELSAGGLDIVVVSLIAIPSYVCAASATPLAAVLLAKGLSPGAVLAGLLLGPATNIATVGFLHRAFGKRAVVTAVASVLLITIALSWATNLAEVPATSPPTSATHEPHSFLTYVAAFALTIAILRSVWNTGLSTWFATLRESFWGGGPGAADHSAHAH